MERTVLSKRHPILEETIKKLYNEGFPKCLKIADFGCATGPNVFFVLSQIINTIYALSEEKNTEAPDIQIYLNDLPDNDFNYIFKLVPSYIKKLNEEIGNKFRNCFIVGVPGSFYGKLFLDKSLHFVHSCSSLHWLSQVPSNLESKGNVYIAMTSSPQVFKAYLVQFQKDFTAFLSFRSEEMISGGHMILTFLGRNLANPMSKSCFNIWELFSNSLRDMVAEGLILEEDVDAFNLPYYTPHENEVTMIIQEEGSFNLERLETFECAWDGEANDENENLELENHTRGRNVAKCVRAFTEPMLFSHFGDISLDDLFVRFSIHVANHLASENTKYINITISLSKK